MSLASGVADVCPGTRRARMHSDNGAQIKVSETESVNGASSMYAAAVYESSLRGSDEVSTGSVKASRISTKPIRPKIPRAARTCR
jgi:hypothetical protein